MNIEDLKQRGLTLDKLLAFLAVARAGSVVRAAGGVESRRSLMSRQIGELESTLGVELFLRKGKSLQITAAGKDLALLTAAYLDELEALSGRFASDKGLLRIGGGAAVLEALLLPGIRNLRQALPDYRFEFIPGSTRQIATRLHDGALDIGIVRSSFEDHSLMRWPCSTMSFVLVARKDFDSTLPNWTVPQFLRRVPLALIRGDGSLVTTLHSMAKEAGVKLVPTCLAETFGHVKQLLLAGQPGGLLPTVLAADLPTANYHVLNDQSLAALSRSLDVVVDKRAAKVRDRLEWVARIVAKAMHGTG